MSEEEKKDETTEEEAENEEKAANDSEQSEETPETSEDDAQEAADAEKEAGDEVPEEEDGGKPKVAPEEQEIDRKKIATEDIEPGMTIRVHEKITDVDPRGETRERTQMFEGMVLGLKGSGVSRTMTLRRVHKGYGVEKIFPIHSPIIEKVELVKRAQVRKAKLNYLKGKKGKFKRKLKEEYVE
jgi:large subunit ribosomal protein L19